MSWVAVGVAAVGAVSAGVSANSKNKQAKAAAGGLDSTIAYARDNMDMFGEKLKWEDVAYTPLSRRDPGYGNIAGATIGGNARNFDAAAGLADRTNDWVTRDAMERINQIYPGFQSSFNQQARNTDNNLRGELSAEDSRAITARRTEAQSLGGGGVNPQQVAADLGLSRLDLQARGAADLTNNTQLMNSIDPLSRRIAPQSMFVDVGQAISSSIAENQFASNFAAQERNAALAYSMLPDPQKAGLANLLAGRAGLQAANQQTSVGTAAVMGGVQGYFGAGGSLTGGAPAAQQSYVPQQQTYIPPATYATAYDQSNGITALSGNGAYAAGPVGQAYNPGTGVGYGDQGGLWASLQTSQKRRN